MNSKLCFLYLFVVIRANSSNFTKRVSPVIFDQRQSGKYNIQISIKDVTIIEMERNEFRDLNSDVDEYYYDESDYTIKPWLNTTTKNPSLPILNSTDSNLTTTPISKPSEELTISSSTISELNTTEILKDANERGFSIEQNIMDDEIPIQIIVEPKDNYNRTIARKHVIPLFRGNSLKFNIQSNKTGSRPGHRRRKGSSFLTRLFNALSAIRFEDDK